MAEKKTTSFVVKIDDTQRRALELLLRDRGWDFSDQPYAHWKVSGPKINLVAYCSGKLTIQGAGAAEFVEFTLEPEILHSFELTAAAAAPEAETDCSMHGGIDESGKGDFFGPLVIAGVCSTPETAPLLVKAGVCDSKMIKSSARIREIAGEIRRISAGKISVVTLRPETYNRLYSKIGNLNRLLAWGHARVIENLLELVPECPRMLSDKFGNESLIRRALMERGRQIEMQQQVRADSDVAVAAASILARDQFVRVMDQLSENSGITLPKGAGPQVKVIARKILEEKGADALASCVKMHFKTWGEITGSPTTDAPSLFE